MKKAKILLTSLLITALLATTYSPAYVFADDLREISGSEPVMESEPLDPVEVEEEFTEKGATDNLLKNGDAETGSIDGWKHDYPGFNTLFQAREKTEYWSHDQVSAHAGKYCLTSGVFIECYHDYKWELSPYLKFTEDKPNESEVELYQDVDISGISAGTELILRGYVDLEGCIRANFYDVNGNLLSENNARDRSITDDTGWKYERLSVLVPKNAAKIRVRLIAKFYRFKGGYGDPFGEYTYGAFDDVSLCVKKPSDYKPVMANTTGEILQNGGGESGNLDGWFYEYEDFTVFHNTSKTEFFSLDDVNPHSGSYCLASDYCWTLAKTETKEIGNYFLGELLSPGITKPIDSSVIMYQEVDLSPLPSGTALTLSGYVAGESDIFLTFYDAGRNQIGGSPATKLDKQEKWDQRTVTNTIPANARYARVNLIAAYHGAAGGYGDPLIEYTRGAFDDISLKAGSGSQKKDISKATVSGVVAKTYTGSAITQSPVITFEGTTLIQGTDYDSSYSNNINVGTATVTFTGKGNYTGNLSTTFAINKAANPLSVSAKNTKTVKYSKLKKKNQTLKGSGIYKYKNKGKGTKTFALSSAKNSKKKDVKKYFAVNKKNGTITVKKGLKKGTYTVTVKVKAAGNGNYKAGTKNVKVKIKVK